MSSKFSHSSKMASQEPKGAVCYTANTSDGIFALFFSFSFTINPLIWKHFLCIFQIFGDIRDAIRKD